METKTQILNIAGFTNAFKVIPSRLAIFSGFKLILGGKKGDIRRSVRDKEPYIYLHESCDWTLLI